MRPRNRLFTNPTFSSTGVLLTTLALAVAVAGCDAPGTAEGSLPEDPREDATEIVLLGTSHFAGSVTDERTSEVGDILSDRRQEELDQVARRVAEWGPDGLFVECTPDQQPRLDSLYRAYRRGEHDPTEEGYRGEIRQLGFRAAEASGLERTTCVDARGIWLGARAREVAGEHNPEVLESYRRHTESYFDRDSLLAELTLGEYLKELNTESRLWDNHKVYNYHYARMGSFDDTGTEVRRESELEGRSFALGGDLDGLPVERIHGAIEGFGGRVVDAPGPEADYVVFAAREVEDGGVGADSVSLQELSSLVQRRSTTWVGFPDHHIGADLVGEWYKRNLRTYANIWRAVEEGDRRILVLMGQGHVWTLRQFLRENPDFEVVPVADVL